MDTREARDIKINDVETQKVIGQKEIIWQKNTVPGPSKLIGGNLQAGFYGEVPTSEFITGDELAKQLGITLGVSQNSNGGWLKFSYMGKTEFIAKKTFRYSISWDNISYQNAVTGQRTIKIGDHTYKIRLMKGRDEGNPFYYTGPYSGDGVKNSEWNRLMLPIHKNAPSNWVFEYNVNSPTENWNIGYTDKDLFTHYTAGNGACTLCQEYGAIPQDRLYRGYSGVSDSNYVTKSDSGNYCGWRPVLELVD